MGTCGSEGPAFNGSRVMVRPEASKRALSSLRMQARYGKLIVKGEGRRMRETDYRMLRAAPLEHVHSC